MEVPYVDDDIDDSPFKIGEALRLKLNTDDQEEYVCGRNGDGSSVSFEPGYRSGVDPAAIPTSSPSRIFCFHIALSVDWLKNWSTSSYKNARKRLEERLNTIRTQGKMDVELCATVEALLDMQRRYSHLMNLMMNSVTTLQKFTDSHRTFALALSNVEPSIADLQKYKDAALVLPNLMDIYMDVINFICQHLFSLYNVVFEDTIETVKRYLAARTEYDSKVAQQSYKNDYGSNTSPELETLRLKYENLRNDVETKMKLLQENKVKVMQKNLALFVEASAAFYSGQKDRLIDVYSKYNLPLLTTLFVDNNGDQGGQNFGSI